MENVEAQDGASALWRSDVCDLSTVLRLSHSAGSKSCCLRGFFRSGCTGGSFVAWWWIFGTYVVFLLILFLASASLNGAVRFAVTHDGSDGRSDIHEEIFMSC